MPGQQEEVQKAAHCSEIEIHYINTGSVYNTFVSATLPRCKQMVKKKKKKKAWRLKQARDVDFASSFYGSFGRILYFT